MTDLICSNCGATCDAKDRARFQRRHPGKCQSHTEADSVKREEMRRLAEGTRCVDDELGNRVVPKANVGKKRVSLV